MYLEDKNTEIC